MHIIKKSILDLDKEGSVFYELSEKLSCASVVDITSRIFSYELKGNEQKIDFTMDDFHKIFHDWQDGEPFCKKKIAGSIETSSYSESQSKMLLDFSNQNLQLSSDEITLFSKLFWNEVSLHFKLPPTHVYVHKPITGSIFHGIFWQFCYIYLNNTTKQGIVLAAAAWD